MNCSYVYICEECGKESKPLGINDYRRLMEEQGWYCKKHTSKDDQNKTDTIPVAGGFIITILNQF